MPTNDLFVSESINLHLFFMRITEEHLIFIQLALPAKNVEIANEAAILRNESVKFLSFILTISNGYVSKNVINSNEIVTKYTYDIKRLTEYYTGMQIDSNITLNEYNMLSTQNMMYRTVSNEQMLFLNNYAINLLNQITDFESRLLNSVIHCQAFTSIFPDRLDHIIDENRQYVKTVQNLQNMKLVPTLESINDEMIFWNENLSDHGEYTAALLDTKEKSLKKVSLEFAERFEVLEDEAKNAKNNPNKIISVINRSLEETKRYKDFNIREVEDILYCKVKSIILPLAADHDLREVSYYLRILYEGSSL